MGRDTFKDRILALHAQGTPAPEIVSIVGCTKQTVYAAIRNARIDGALPDELSPSDQINKLRKRVKALEILVAKLSAQFSRRTASVDPAPEADQGIESDTRQRLPPSRSDYRME
jgi:hypothetical protein